MYDAYQRYLLILTWSSSINSKLYQKPLKPNLMKMCGMNIRRIRRNRDFTQEYMAFEMGISQKSYSDIENSKVKINLEILTKVADILEIRPAEICGMSEKCFLNYYEDKYKVLLNYMKAHNISIPEEYL